MPKELIENLKELHDDLAEASKAKGRAWFDPDYCGGMAREVGKAIEELEKKPQTAEFQALGNLGQDIFY